MDKLTAGLRPYLLLSLLSVILILPGLAVMPPMDRDESRFIQASRQMLETGDYIRIQFQNEMRAKKPVGAYWLQAASVKAFSHPLSRELWAYRLPSALSAWAVALLTFAFGQSLIGRRPALLAGIMTISALILLSEAHQAKSDAILLLCALVAQGTLMRFYVAGRAREAGGVRGGPGWPEALLFWLAQGAAILVKGPVVPVISLLTILALWIADRRAHWLVALRPASGLMITLAVAGPWFAAISQATDGAFVGEAVKGDLLPKLLGAQEHHGGWPGTYLLLAGLTFWPASLLGWPAMVRAWSERRRVVIRGLLAWVLPCWVMFELIPTKLPHYVLPAFPAIALITAALVCERQAIFAGRAAKGWYAAWTMIGVVLAAAVVMLPMRMGGGFEVLSLPAALGILLATALPALLAWKGRLEQAALALALTAVTAFPVIFSQTLPHLDRLWVSRSIAAMVHSLGVSEPIAATGFTEPSLVVLLGTETRLVDGASAAVWLVKHPDSLAAVGDNEEVAFHAQAAGQNLEVEPLGRVQGFNLARGKKVTVTLYGAKRP